MLTGISSDYLYFYRDSPKRVSDFHKPYFLAFCPIGQNIEKVRSSIVTKWKDNSSEDSPFSKIDSFGELAKFWKFLGGDVVWGLEDLIDNIEKIKID